MEWDWESGVNPNPATHPILPILIISPKLLLWTRPLTSDASGLYKGEPAWTLQEDGNEATAVGLDTFVESETVPWNGKVPLGWALGILRH